VDNVFIIFRLFIVFLKNLIPLSKDDVDIKSSKFNPLKIFVVVLLFFALFMDIWLIERIQTLTKRIKEECPTFIAD